MLARDSAVLGGGLSLSLVPTGGKAVLHALKPWKFRTKARIRRSSAARRAGACGLSLIHI